MRYIFVLTLLFLTISAVSAQTHQQALEEFERLKQQIESLKQQSEEVQKQILLPDDSDIAAAKSENVNVFRLLPREKYDKDIFKVRGGGAYYSFTKKSHSYNEIPQIELSQNQLRVGFYGASYGFMTDLGKISLSEINESSKSVNFLLNYTPPEKISEARVEYKRGVGFENLNQNYKNFLPPIVGNTYLLRAVSFDEADILVALNVFRKDSDGSLIIFWKPIKEFEIPKLIRDDSSDQNKTIKFEVNNEPSDNLAAKIAYQLKKNGFTDVEVTEDGKFIVLRGTVPKGKMAEVIRVTMDFAKRPVKNELSEK